MSDLKTLLTTFDPRTKQSHIDLLSEHQRMSKHVAELVRKHGTSEVNELADSFLLLSGMIAGANAFLLDKVFFEAPPKVEGEDVNS